MSPNPSLTATQEQVLAMIASGSTAADAARTAGVHRNTVANWLHDDRFRASLERARADKALFYQDQADAVAAEALNALRAIMNDPATPAAVRVRAAIAMLDRAAQAPPQPEQPVLMHKNAQPEASAKIGRNEVCPCGSGLKFKRCCLNKPTIPPNLPSAA